MNTNRKSNGGAVTVEKLTVNNPKVVTENAEKGWALVGFESVTADGELREITSFEKRLLELGGYQVEGELERGKRTSKTNGKLYDTFKFRAEDSVIENLLAQKAKDAAEAVKKAAETAKGRPAFAVNAGTTPKFSDIVASVREIANKTTNSFIQENIVTNDIQAIRVFGNLLKGFTASMLATYQLGPEGLIKWQAEALQDSDTLLSDEEEADRASLPLDAEAATDAEFEEHLAKESK